jgi:hypothetical protein
VKYFSISKPSTHNNPVIKKIPQTKTDEVSHGIRDLSHAYKSLIAALIPLSCTFTSQQRLPTRKKELYLQMCNISLTNPQAMVIQ